MKIKQAQLHIIDYNGIDYLRFSSDSWYHWYGNSLEYVTYSALLEEEFQKQLKQDFDNDKYA